MKKQTIVSIVSGGVVLAGLSIIAAGYTRLPKSQSVSSNSEVAPGPTVSSVVDLSNPRILLGYVQNVFAAKVGKEVSRVPRPYSSDIQYDAEVVYNIKGNVQGNVVVDLDDSEGASLTPGATYLFAALHIEEMSPWYYLGSDSERRTLITEDASLSNDQLLELIKKNDRTYELLNAYPNEIVRYTGKDASFAVNAFQSLSSDKKQAVYAKFQELVPPRPVPTILPPTPSGANLEPENSLSRCTDGIDNDGDGLTDKADPACAGILREDNYSLCHDNIDNNGNGLVDCADPSCAAFCPSQATPPPAPPTPPPAPSSTEEINPPVISNLASVVASTSVTISWTTNKPATSQMLFGSSTAMSANVPVDGNLSTNHSLHVSSLVPGTTYYYEAQSKDTSGKTSTTAQQSFTTLGESNSALPAPPPAPDSTSTASSTGT